MEFRLLGRVASKKNSKRLVRLKSGRVIPISSKAWMEFAKTAIKEVKSLYNSNEPIKAPYYIEYVFHLKGKGRVDLDNMIAGINDILQEAGVISDDNEVVRIKATKVLGFPDYMTYICINPEEDCNA